MERISEEAKAQQAQDEYLVYFIDRDERYWWDWLFHPRAGFRHCFILYWDEYVLRWLLVDWRLRKLDIMMMFDFEAGNLLHSAKRSRCTVVRFPKPAETAADRPQLVSYCSNLMARFLGFNNHLILTPYQLYRKLIAAGGEVVFDWRNHDVRIETQRPNPGTTRVGSSTDRTPERTAR
jgi:hypothetical protein